MRIHINNLNSKIETDNPKLLKALYDLYTFRVPGGEYSHAYKRNHWDGKIHFISSTGTFKTGLLSRLLIDLKKIDCEPEILGDLHHIVTKHKTDYSISGFTYYDYQQELI